MYTDRYVRVRVRGFFFLFIQGLVVCFCHHYSDAHTVVLLATEVSFKPTSLADWQTFPNSHAAFGSASLLPDDPLSCANWR